MQYSRKWLVVLLFVPLAAFLRAEPPLFRTGVIDPTKLLPPPALLESDEMKAELGLVLRVQESRTAQDIERVKAESKFGLPAFQSVLGPWLTVENCPKLDALFTRLQKEGKTYTTAAKKYFNRPRPQTKSGRVKPVLAEEDNGYPSGHAMRGQLFATILAELAPEKKAELLARGRELGWYRVIAGVHFPSDLAGGRVLGQALAQEFLANPAFRDEFTSIRAEFEEARKRAPR